MKRLHLFTLAHTSGIMGLLPIPLTPFTALVIVGQMARIAPNTTLPNLWLFFKVILKLLSLKNEVYFSPSWICVWLKWKWWCIIQSRYQEAYCASASVSSHCPDPTRAACWRTREPVEQRPAIAVEAVQYQEAPSRLSGRAPMHLCIQLRLEIKSISTCRSCWLINSEPC